MRPDLRVVFDLQATQSLHHGSRGIARYTAEHAAAVHRVAPDVVSAFTLNPRFVLPPAAERFIPTGHLRWASSREPTLAAGPLIFHVTSPFELGIPLHEIWPVAVRRPDVRLAVTLYDLIPLIYPERYLTDAATRGRYRARLQMLRAADIVLAISESARQDGIRLLGIRPERIKVIDAGVTGNFRPTVLDPSVLLNGLTGAVPGLRPGFFLYTGGVDFRKNMEGLIRAHAALPPGVRARHQLVIVCGMDEHQRRHYEHVAAEAGSLDDVLLTGFVSEEALEGLYQATHTFVFPSVYEGFGLPIAEAVECGAPVIASSRSSLPEVTPSAEGLFDPEAPGELTDMLLRAATDDAFVGRLREASRAAAGHFTWERTAELTLDAYRERWDARPARPRRRPRIAVVTPYPPDRSGIATYSRDLMAALGRRADVEGYIGGPPEDYVPAPEGCSLHHWRAFEDRSRLVGFDRVLYCMGNNLMHGFVMDLARRVPGTILCHDVRLVRYYAAQPDGRPFVQALRDMYAGRLPPALDREDVGYEEAERAGLWMLGDVARHAEQVLVHSDYARTLVLLEAQAQGVVPDVRAIPFGYAPDRRSGPPALSRAPSAPLVVSFGLVDPIKRPDLLVQALPHIRGRHPGTRLVLAGPVTPEFAGELRSLARAAGVGAAVTITGALDDDRYRRWMDSADVAVQLRAMSQGEASLTVAEALAAGVPTVVTRAGWMAEIPERVVRGVPLDADAAQVATVVGDLLGDPEAWSQLSREGRRWAARHSFEQVADAVADAMALR